MFTGSKFHRGPPFIHLCTEVRIIIGTVFINFSPGVVNFKAGVSLVRRFIPGRFTACPGTDFASFFHRGSHGGRIYRGT